MRARLLLAAIAAGLVVIPAAAGSVAPGSVYGYGEAGARLSQLPSRGFTGGPITTTNTGETLQLYVADAYLAADPAFAQRFADALGALVHGPEITSLTTYVATPDTVSRVCGGSSALACYDGQSETIVTPGEDVRGIRATSVLAHEYGHHVANNRNNEPWNAIDYGTKRWASYTNICRQSEEGTLSPGSEGESYERNPGEGFAEVYRVLNERRQGLVETPWLIVSRLFFPDDEALRRLEQDVLDPWMQPRPTVVRGRFAATAPAGRTVRLTTPYDGTVVVTLRASLKTKLELRVRDGRDRVLAVDTSGSRTKTVTVDLCGQRALKIGVRRASGAGTFVLSISKP